MAAFLILAAGLGLLVLGGEALVRGASGLARTIGVAPLLVGLTVVAFGTSAPELAVSVRSAAEGEPGIAVGNVIGSNIFNTLLILGFAALVRPLRVAHSLVRLEAPLVVAASGLVWLLAADGRLGRTDGALLILGALGYVAWSIRLAGRQREIGNTGKSGSHEARAPRRRQRSAVQLVSIGTGLVLLVLGSHWAVDGAVEIADALGVSPLVVGLTVIAAGTSLPEAATSWVAARRGEEDISVGNVMGSNLFNLLGILGLSAAVAPAGLAVPELAVSTDLPVMVAIALLCWVALASAWRISRREGAAFVLLYVVYAAYLGARTMVLDPQPAGWLLAAAISGLAVVLLVTRVGGKRGRR